MMPTVAQVLQDRLYQGLSTHTAGKENIAITVIDQSAQHRGHKQAPAGGNSHFKIIIRHADFKPQDRLSQHRMIYTMLNELIVKFQIHAITLCFESTKEPLKNQSKRC